MRQSVVRSVSSLCLRMSSHSPYTQWLSCYFYAVFGIVSNPPPSPPTGDTFVETSERIVFLASMTRLLLMSMFSSFFTTCSSHQQAINFSFHGLFPPLHSTVEMHWVEVTGKHVLMLHSMGRTPFLVTTFLKDTLSWTPPHPFLILVYYYGDGANWRVKCHSDQSHFMGPST